MAFPQNLKKQNYYSNLTRSPITYFFVKPKRTFTKLIGIMDTCFLFAANLRIKRNLVVIKWQLGKLILIFSFCLICSQKR